MGLSEGGGRGGSSFGSFGSFGSFCLFYSFEWLGQCSQTGRLPLR